MLFNSIEFLIFFPIVVVLFFSAPNRWRTTILLIASYYFYMSWEPAYGLLIFCSTVIDYIAARLMGATKISWQRKLLLAASLTGNLGILFFFKYFNFFFTSIEPIFRTFTSDFSSPTLSLLLPVGISFYTFQSLSYTIDVYRQKRTPEKSFSIFALYVSFFPQLVAGPIETSTRLLPQFYQKVSPDAGRFVSGFRLALWGFFKKVVIADNAGRIVDVIYGNSSDTSGTALMVGTFFFAVQIYCDFSGYSDIARGTARILGYDLMLNFKRPYFARSVGEFWRRWHISLMNWFREYIYFPLGGSRVPKSTWVRNIGLVFLISGVWHGANWTFIVWGLLNFAYIIIGRFTEPERHYLVNLLGLSKLPKLMTVIQILTTFTLIGFSWIFFRSQSLEEAVMIVKKIGHDLIEVIMSPQHLLPSLINAGYAMKVTKVDFIILTGSIMLLVGVEIYLEQRRSLKIFYSLPRPVRWICYYILISIIIFGGYFGESVFLYFQF